MANPTKEHLVSADRLLVVSRNVLLRAIRDVQEGKDPPNVIRDPSANHFPIVTFNGMVPVGENWRDISVLLERGMEYV